MILYINCCIRKESRTDRLAREVLQSIGDYTELFLPAEDIKPLTEEMLEKRTALLADRNFDYPMFKYARQFAEADRIVISAPFWDGSFPSLLKVYIENIYAVGIVSRYCENGIPIGMCRAEELIYVTTAGGPYIPDFSYEYIKTIAENCFGIKKTKLIKAEMLDIEGMDAERILSDTINKFR